MAKVKRVKLLKTKTKYRRLPRTTDEWLDYRWGKGRSDKRSGKARVWDEPLVVRRGI